MKKQMKFWIEYLIIAILILLTGFLIFWSAFGRIDRFMDSVNWKENFGGLEPEPRLKTSFLSASLGPAVISDNSVKPQASFAGEEKPKRKKEKVGGPGDAEVSEITGYCLNAQPMASGKMPYSGAIANNQYPLGTKVKIENKIYAVEDRMAKRFRTRWDIWFFSCEEAINWGIRKLPVNVLDN